MKLTHNSVFEMEKDEKLKKGYSHFEDYINEEALIQKLIR
jgi:hypothetical protein